MCTSKTLPSRNANTPTDLPQAIKSPWRLSFSKKIAKNPAPQLAAAEIRKTMSHDCVILNKDLALPKRLPNGHGPDCSTNPPSKILKTAQNSVSM